MLFKEIDQTSWLTQGASKSACRTPSFEVDRTEERLSVIKLATATQLKIGQAVMGLLSLPSVWFKAKHHGQTGHLNTFSSLPSSFLTSPVLKQPASAGGTREPMCVV